ncbi:protein with an N-terminal beta-propellor repeat domain protein [Aquimarina atlantica]|uniref:Protein with an N-terminal beta-propellor repeat domain protein n=1 Tax=Aquimarina atlantica TaxID=1317122 RepID=A0A023BYQ5_9FLAO|nr:hypothetical protein [Aquimarina atlantica]EZH75130.1 protein with an N-terminal beta-propellor repeat domain protein [Aquimarina atlantica]
MNRSKFLFNILIICIATSILIACGSDDEDNVTPVPPLEGFLGEIDWVKTFGGSNEDNALSVVETTDGGYVIAGYTQSIDGDITDKTAPDSDYWLLKITKEGEILWSKTYGGSGDERGEKIIQTTDGGYAMVGYSRSADEDVTANAGLQDYWIVKTDASGGIQWEKSFGFPGIDRAFSVVQTRDGGYFITGFLDVTASGGEGNDNKSGFSKHGVGEFWGIKLNASGEKEWRRFFGGTNNDRSYDVVQTQDDGFIMIGSSESVDFDITNSKGSYDFWAVKINKEGTKLWEKSFGGSEIDVGYAIAATGDGKFLIVGDSRSVDGDISSANGNADLWLIQIDGNGNLLWEKSLGGTAFDTGRAIAKMQNGGFVITGNSRSNDIDVGQNKGQSDVWSMIITINGEVQWKLASGGSQAEFGEGCIETSDKKVIVVGNSESSDFDIPANKGSKDVLVIKYK